MRGVKFRIWDSFNGVMIYSENYNSLWKFFKVYEDLVRGENAPKLMQFTGLKDRNVWAGDIIGEPRVGDKLEVIGIVKYDEDLAAFITEKVNGGWEYLHKHFDENKNHKVIGNICENPELLEKAENVK